MIVLTGSVRLCLVVTVVFMDHLGEQCKALRIQQHCYVHSLTFQITIALVLFRLPIQLIIPNEKRYNRVLCANEFAHVNQLHVNKKYHFAKKKFHNVQTEFHYWKTTKITIVSGTYQVWKQNPSLAFTLSAQGLGRWPKNDTTKPPSVRTTRSRFKNLSYSYANFDLLQAITGWVGTQASDDWPS